MTIDWNKLEQNQNPFALVVMAHLKSQGVKDGQERKHWKPVRKSRSDRGGHVSLKVRNKYQIGT